jgi:Nucleotidyl transferase AbiEii toxin, Type IV TA system
MATAKTQTSKRKRTPKRPPRAGPNSRPRGAKWLTGNAEWEKMKATCRNLSHRAAVAESAFLSYQWRDFFRSMTTNVELAKVVQVLNEKKIPFVLTGAYGISGWTGRPRATHDVDVLVRTGRNHARAVKALKALYPQLEVRQLPGVTAFFVPGETESVIDVTFPHREDQRATLETGIWIEDKGLKFRVPTLECALANKYGAMLSLNRDATKRAQDAVDFSFMVKHTKDEGRAPVDEKLLYELGEKVWPGGGKELVRIFEEAHAGNVPNLTPTQK